MVMTTGENRKTVAVGVVIGGVAGCIVGLAIPLSPLSLGIASAGAFCGLIAAVSVLARRARRLRLAAQPVDRGGHVDSITPSNPQPRSAA